MSTTRKRKGSETRKQILEFAEAAVLEKGFGATSIEELITAVGITKSGFFYHFKDKGALAKALLQRYLDREEILFDDIFRRAEELNDDPLHGFLVGLKMLAELLADLPETHPGCLVASVTYQEQLFNQEVIDMNRNGVLSWRKRFRSHLDRISERYPPKTDIDMDAMADMFSALVDGGITLSKAVKDKDVLPRQVMLYRDFVKRVFLG
ncbi:MAG: TetR/AcrR family transcriptional regulator [Rhodospirillaceae bacterium]|jgi:TetR/AcrR family transcriptional regulator, transcriptional repressor for nem operon|nr:TetR/AcrR family transcriptional regulator [Rhodospirillaceae bacterium]MBT4218827.1 TetR/AcrR family transcriptional regulator [Rhodospirillaceae bacterium]MBT4463476.1 TetR/AcrR family transcriptional regulator [Rhodospirillaceae bacterium]MBT5309029.1 TetR/AcrR family transcriptional regulator [Rhodospirillaceae bacterium]MBT7355118.1 TetR/AcrR family transcriptional regulator [Rhodospirillaceae bacterium]